MTTHNSICAAQAQPRTSHLHPAAHPHCHPRAISKVSAGAESAVEGGVL